jgi:hypothetical protein
LNGATKAATLGRATTETSRANNDVNSVQPSWDGQMQTLGSDERHIGE